jgi:hypothetical protein
MRLLARIQAGQQITTVDDLYKKMVLEEPETLAACRRCRRPLRRPRLHPQPDADGAASRSAPSNPSAA